MTPTVQMGPKAGDMDAKMMVTWDGDAAVHNPSSPKASAQLSAWEVLYTSAKQQSLGDALSVQDGKHCTPPARFNRRPANSHIAPLNQIPAINPVVKRDWNKWGFGLDAVSWEQGHPLHLWQHQTIRAVFTPLSEDDKEQFCPSPLLGPHQKHF